MVRLAALSGAAFSAAAAALAQAETAPPAYVTGFEDRIVVQGRRIEDLDRAVNDFVGEVTAPIEDRGIARFHRQLCVGVVGMQPDSARYIADRVSEIALDVGLNPGDPGCRPNLFIIFTHEAAHVAAALIEAGPRNFRPYMGTAGTTQGLAALAAFRESDAPVRWWHVSLPVEAATGARAVSTARDDRRLSENRFEVAPNVNVRGASRITSAIRDELQYAVMIVDVTKLNGANFRQVADYVAMVGLTQVDPAADTSGYDSVLNLFVDPSHGRGLTPWDRSFLQAAYRFDTQLNPQFQEASLAREMIDIELSSGSDAE
jgi:hypothetical protein